MPALADPSADLIDGLPGEELIRPGLRDLAEGRSTAGALLIEIAQSRLREAGLTIPQIPPATQEAEQRLYALLEQRHGSEAHYQFGALTQRLDKFCRALESARRASHE